MPPTADEGATRWHCQLVERLVQHLPGVPYPSHGHTNTNQPLQESRAPRQLVPYPR